MAFALHHKLAQDCAHVVDLALCRVLLMRDARFPWLILVPKVEHVREIVELPAPQQQQFWQESAQASQCLLDVFKADKLNVAALGNMVPQLHVHHIARFIDDEAWPNPVWGFGQAKAYSEEALQQRVVVLQQHFKQRGK